LAVQDGPCGKADVTYDKLCCGANHTYHPSSFKCIDNTFEGIDQNLDGKISKLEWDVAHGITSIYDESMAKRANAEAAATQAKTYKDEGTIFDDPDFNPVTYFYVEGTAVMFSLAALYALFLVFKNMCSGPKRLAPGAPGLPERLQVKVTTDHAGIYVLVEGTISNGFPVWKHEAQDYYIFASTSGKWLVGGPPNKDAGAISSAKDHCGEWPHLMGTGQWMIFDGTSFQVDASVSISIPAPGQLEVRTTGEAAGKYMLVPNQQANGYPLWQRTDSKMWIYSGLAGQWFVGGEQEQADNFVCDRGVVSSVAPHEGRMPDKLGSGQWMAFDGEQWKVDMQITVA
jgi:hypothetical protein